MSDFTPNRSRDGPERLLGSFSGYLQADAYAGYNRLLAGPNVIEVACWAHARRKFYDAKLTAPDLAHAAFGRIGQLYAIAREAKADNLKGEERRQVRQAFAVPLLKSFGEWLKSQHERVLPKSRWTGDGVRLDQLVCSLCSASASDRQEELDLCGQQQRRTICIDLVQLYRKLQTQRR